MTLIEELTELGINTSEALGRFMNNAGLFERMLKKFPPNVEKLDVLPFIESGDYETALANAHTLKGVTGNLSLTPLYTAYTEIVKEFRANNPERAKELLVEILPLQEKIVACINKYN